MKIELRTNVERLAQIIDAHLWKDEAHDSLAAHAYQAAIAEAPSSVCMDSGDVPSWIETRAAELLASYLDEGK